MKWSDSLLAELARGQEGMMQYAGALSFAQDNYNSQQAAMQDRSNMGNAGMRYSAAYDGAANAVVTGPYGSYTMNARLAKAKKYLEEHNHAMR